jgi:plasmid stabilization system protein ParE
MAFRVELSPEAVGELEQAYLWIREQAPKAADRWYNGLIDVLRSLADQPHRCPLAPENDAVDEEIRQLHYGRRHHRYRIHFTVHQKSVRILHIRHGTRTYLAPDSGSPSDE